MCLRMLICYYCDTSYCEDALRHGRRNIKPLQTPSQEDRDIVPPENQLLLTSVRYTFVEFWSVHYIQQYTSYILLSWVRQVCATIVQI